MNARARRIALGLAALAAGCSSGERTADPPPPTGEKTAGAQPLPTTDEPPTDRRVTVADCELRLLEAGERAAPPVLLLHGAAFGADTWRELGTLEVLAGAGLRALAVDLPGYGGSPACELPREELLAALLDALELSSAVVVSPSMSGAFSLPLVALQPERVSGYVPIAPAGVERWRARLATCSVPALVLWGEADTVFPPSGAAELAASFAAARVVLFEGAAHPCYLDDPELFHEWLVRFARDPAGAVSGSAR